jgi:tetratricopeptide (TPR) repeat protein
MGDSLEDGPISPEGGAPPPPPDIEALFQQAEVARQRQVWEEAIRLYRQTLLIDPTRIKSRLGLGQCYEAKSREEGFQACLQMALDEYRKAVRQDPSCVPAYDALLAVAVKTRDLDVVLDECKATLLASPDNPVLKEVIRKIQTLLLMQTERKSDVTSPPPPLVSFLFGLVAPGLALLSTAAYILLRLKGGGLENAALIGQVLIKVAVAAVVSFLGYKTYLVWRHTR